MSFTQRTTMTIITSILVLATFLFGGGITASAASASLPGDALYPVKTSLENARASLTNDDAVKAGLFLGFAGRRLDEIKSLIASGRFDHVPQAASLFERDIEMAREAIRHLAEDHPARAAELDVQAASILKGFDDALNAMLSGAPVDVQPVLQDAMKASSSAVDSMDNANTNEDINDDHGNDNNSNANTNEDINNNDNSNANTNEDINNNDNGNDNSNENINNDNGNVNSNENINNDNGSNTNTNTNSNDKHGGKDGGGSGGGGGGGDGGGGGGGGGDSGGG